MERIQDKYVIGEWKVFRKDNCSGKLIIEKTGETYKCVWNMFAESGEHYIGLGILLGNRILVSRFKRENENDGLPEGGIGVYRPIGDHRSNCALWSNMKNFNTLGSGIALRQETSTSFEGDYKVRYFLKEHESPIFDLKITKKESNDLYALTWAINNNIALHGIGMIVNGEMALAWGELNVNWELVVLNLETDGDEYYLTSSRSTQTDDIIFHEVLKKEVDLIRS